jgi:hypothetical protein
MEMIQGLLRLWNDKHHNNQLIRLICGQLSQL